MTGTCSTPDTKTAVPIGPTPFLGENPRPAKKFLDTGIEQVAGHASREGHWGWDGASLETVSAIAHDPAAADINLYRYCGNDPTIAVDPLGLEWKVARRNGATAQADVHKDTVAALAAQIGLRAADYRKWLTRVSGRWPSSANEVMDCGKFRIPNVVICYWAGDLGAFGKWWVNWDDSVAYLKALGFDAIQFNHSAGTKFALQTMLVNGARSAILQGLYFWGHGWSPYPSKGLASRGRDNILDYASTGGALPYKLGLGLIFACDGNSGKSALFSNAPGGIWVGCTGTLVPIGTDYFVGKYFAPGEQRTR